MAFGGIFDDVVPRKRGWSKAMVKWNKDAFTKHRGWGRWNPDPPMERARDRRRHRAWIEKLRAYVQVRLDMYKELQHARAAFLGALEHYTDELLDAMCGNM